MKEDEVHSLILEQIDDIEEDDLRSFINEILTHERSRLDQPRPEFREKYKELANNYANNTSLDEYDQE